MSICNILKKVSIRPLVSESKASPEVQVIPGIGLKTIVGKKSFLSSFTKIRTRASLDYIILINLNVILRSKYKYTFIALHAY